MGTHFLNALALTATTLGAALATPGVVAAQRADRPARAVTVPATRPQAVAPGARTAPAAGALADAAQKGDLATVRQLLARGGDVNAAQGDGMTALHWAAERGDSAMVGALLRAKADARARTRIGNYTPLHLAARIGHAGTVRTLLAAGAEVDAPTLGGATALHLAATAGNPEVVRALIEKGAQPNAREAVWGQTPLLFAAERDRAAAITALIAGGADPSIRTTVVNLTEQEARQQAAEKKRNAVLIAFEPKARRDSADADHKRAVDAAKAAAAAAAAQARPAAAPAPNAKDSKNAKDKGAKPAAADSASAPRDPGQLVNAQQGGGGFAGRLPVREPRGPFTPEQIQLAIDSGRAVMLAKVLPVDSVREKVDTANGGVAGYTKQVGSVGGLTALHHAARQGSVAAALALVDGGAKLNDTSGVDRMTPLMMAAVNGQFDVAKVLVERGADPNIVTTYGMSPLYAVLNAQWAPKSRYPQPQAIQTQQTSYLELAAVLLAKGAKPDERVTKQPWWFAYNNCGSFNCGLEVIDGTTPFWRAAYALDVDAMRLLKKHGATDTIPSTPPKPAARGGGAGAAAGAVAAAGAARPDSAAARRADTVAMRPGGQAMAPKDPPAHTSAAVGAPSMTPTTLPTSTAPVAVAVTDTTKPVTAADSAVRRAARTPPVARSDAAPAPAPAAAAPQGGGQGAAPGPKLDPEIVKLARVAPVGPGVLPIHAVAGVGYGNGFAGNAHRYAPDAWMPALRYLVEELKADVNARDNNGFTPLHHAAARGDNEMIRYLVSKGADVKAVSRTGRTVVDMANGPVQRLRPFPETIELLEKLGAKNQHLCVSC